MKNFVGNVYAYTIALCMLMTLRSIEPKRIGNYEMLTGNFVPNNTSAILHKLINALKTETKLYIPYIIYVSAVCMCVLSSVQFSATPQTAAWRAPLSMEFPGWNTGVGCHFLL